MLYVSTVIDVRRLTGDRVQWFRAEAEMERWLEESEFLQAQFMCCIRSFTKMRDIWTVLAQSSSQPGHIAYAKKTAEMYAKMANDAQAKFTLAGYGHRVLQKGEILADHIVRDHLTFHVTALPTSLNGV